MKKVLSIIMVLAMLAMSVTVYAVSGTGSSTDPYLISNEDTTPITITVPADTEVWIQANNSNGSVLKVTEASSTNYFFWYCRQNYIAEDALTLVPDVNLVNLKNTGTSDLVISLLLEGGADEIKGTVDNPENIELVENDFSHALGAYVTTELEAGNNGYYYTFNAPADGVISVYVSAYDSEYNDIGWMFFVNNITKSRYGEFRYSDDAEVVNPENVKVSANDEIVVFASTYNPESRWSNPAGGIGVNISFAGVGTSLCPEDITAGNHSTTLAADSQGYYYNWTAAESGTATFTMNTAANWQYSITKTPANGFPTYGDTHWHDDDPVVSTESHTVAAGDVLTIWVNTYDPSNMFGSPAGALDWTLSFTAGEGGGNDDNIGGGGDDDIIGGGDDTLEVNWELSDKYLSVGTDSYPASNTYPYTVYAFEPTEVGKYTFTSTDSLIGLVSNNGMWITAGTSTNAITDGVVTENSFEWTSTSVGQSIWVAALPDTNVATITVEYEEVVIHEIPREYYENTVTPEAFEFGGNADELMYVDTFDGIEDTAVLGADGYYHLNSANGPILFANLNDPMMSLSAANSYGQLKQLINENGEVVLIIDYTLAMIDYLACMDQETGLYPLTADLIEVFNKAGTSLGWYGAEGWLGGEEADAWMFACYYDEAITGEGDIPGGNGNNADQNTTSPSTGDNVMIIVTVAVVALAATATLLVFRRRRTN